MSPSNRSAHSLVFRIPQTTRPGRRASCLRRSARRPGSRRLRSSPHRCHRRGRRRRARRRRRRRASPRLARRRRRRRLGSRRCGLQSARCRSVGCGLRSAGPSPWFLCHPVVCGVAAAESSESRAQQAIVRCAAGSLDQFGLNLTLMSTSMYSVGPANVLL